MISVAELVIDMTGGVWVKCICITVREFNDIKFKFDTITCIRFLLYL